MSVSLLFLQMKCIMVQAWTVPLPSVVFFPQSKDMQVRCECVLLSVVLCDRRTGDCVYKQIRRPFNILYWKYYNCAAIYQRQLHTHKLRPYLLFLSSDSVSYSYRRKILHIQDQLSHSYEISSEIVVVSFGQILTIMFHC